MYTGIDLGGTKIEILVLSNTGQELLRKRIATPQGDYQKTILTVVTDVNFLNKS